MEPSGQGSNLCSNTFSFFVVGAEFAWYCADFAWQPYRLALAPFWPQIFPVRAPLRFFFRVSLLPANFPLAAWTAHSGCLLYLNAWTAAVTLLACLCTSRLLVFLSISMLSS